MALAMAFAIVASAPAADLQDRLDRKNAGIERARDQKRLLTTEISRYEDQIDELTGEVAALRNREAAVDDELRSAQAQLDAEQSNLRVLRVRLRRSIEALEDRLVSIYKAGEPSTIAIVLETDGFDDALGRYEYLQAIQDQNAGIVERVTEIRDDTRATVERVKTTRDGISARKDELARTRAALEARESELSAARKQSRMAFARVDGHVDRLEAGASKIEDKIRKQLAAAAAESSVPVLSAGPVQSGSGAMIWPVNGTLTSPFGSRWGSLHAGIDIAAPGGTPIRAARAGNVVLMQSEAESGGYGNYTCVDHGGGLSTCYAHQSGFATSVGATVEQGDVIGYVGNTGHSFGDHLHFETRVGGVPADPMGYL